MTRIALSLLVGLLLSCGGQKQAPCADMSAKPCKCSCTGGAPATGGSAATGGHSTVGGSKATGGSRATGGAASTGGSSASPGNLANCIAALSKDTGIKNVAAQQGITVKSLATKECSDPNILSRYP